ncbi:MAG TPA: chlorite dismutase family protein [Candidatus Acidoferrales bacterium]|nr:chlorite dismutase family protein [Candidatus Acidoferrales bacterium]
MLCHNYLFFTIRPEFYTLTHETQKAVKETFLTELQNERSVISTTYSTLGLKTNTNILIWFQADEIETIQEFVNKLLHTKLGNYLVITYTLFGMTRPTQYSDRSTGHLHTERKGGKYLIIYPFTKTKEWHMLDFDARRKLMGGHVMVGKKYPQIEQLLLYSYGIDDNEFIVSYEMDDLSAFQSLVMELRSDKVRAYTQNDTPIFTCVYRTPQKALEFI